MEGKIFYRILANLYCTKCNEINITLWCVQQQILYTVSHKRFLMNYGICFEKARNVFSTVFHGFKHFLTKLKNVYSFGLFVCLSVRARSNWRKYSSNAFKFRDTIDIWYRVNSIENDMYDTKGSFTEIQKSFPIHFGGMGEGVLNFWDGISK